MTTPVTHATTAPGTDPVLTRPRLRRRIADRLAAAAMIAATVAALVPLGWLLVTVVAKGAGAVTGSGWFTHSLNGLTSTIAGGGVYHAVLGTLIIGAVTTVIAVPVGVAVAVYLVEQGPGTRLGRITTFMVDILSGVPSIVAALFVYALWVVTFGLQRSGVAVSIALVLLMVPMVVRGTEEMLRVIPHDQREAAWALGVPRWKTVLSVVLPAAAPGIVTAVMLAVARVLGETAPLLILVGYAPYIELDPTGGEMGTLPGVMIDQLNNPSAIGLSRLWGAALTLIGLIALLNIGARLIARRTRIGRR